MGNWHISIEGVGIHHNGRKDDADAVFVETVRQLKESGHTVTHASITTGGAHDHESARALHEHLAKPAE
jgi:hypothetical protein